MQIKLESTQERERALFDLVQSSNMAALGSLLNIGTNPNAVMPDATGRRPLHVAAQCGNTGAILFLLEAGADLSLCDTRSMTPLHCAAETSEKAVRLLIERGAQLEGYNNWGATPLHCAANAGRAAAVRALLESGANAHAETNRSRSTALHLAADQGSPEVCEILLAQGVKVDALNSEDQTALYIAATKGQLGACRVLVAAGSSPDYIPNKRDYSPTFRSPLQASVLHGRTEVVKYFLLTCHANHQLRSHGGEKLSALARDHSDIRSLLMSLETEADLANVITDATASTDQPAFSPARGPGLL